MFKSGILFLLRSLSIFLVLYLFTDPSFSINQKKESKPLSILLVDNSRSMSKYSFEAKKAIEVLSSKVLNSNSELKVLDLSLEEYNSDSVLKYTNINTSIQSVVDEFSNQNLTDIYLLSDGNYNLGSNPSTRNYNNQVAISSIVVGDTTNHGDMKISNVEYNPTVFVNENIPIKVNIASYKVSTNTYKVNLYKSHNGRDNLLDSKNISVKSNFDNKVVNFNIKSLPVGNNDLKIRVSKDINEKNTYNNTREIKVDVIEDKSSIAILYDRIHPDVSFLYSLFYKNEKYTVDKINTTNGKGTGKHYDIYFVLNPSSTSETYIDDNSSTVYFLNKYSDVSVINKRIPTVSLSPNSNPSILSPISLNSDFHHFNFGNDIKSFLTTNLSIESYQYKLNVEPNNSLLYGSSSGKKYPLISFFIDANKSCVINGTNLWKTKLLDFRINKNHSQIEDFFYNIVSFLSSSNKNSQLVVNTDKSNYMSNESINIDAYTFNSVLKLSSADSIFISVDTKTRNKMLKTGQKYSSSFSKLSKGAHKIKVEAYINGSKIIKSKTVKVFDIDIENQNISSDFEIMKNIAYNNNGSVVMSTDIKDLTTKVRSAKVEYDKKTENIIDNKWAILLLLLTLSLEWALRKYFQFL